MAFTYIGSWSFGSSKASSAAVIAGPTASSLPAVGELLVVHIYADNAVAVTGQQNEVSSVVDSVGNTYTRAVDYTFNNGGAGNGANVSIWFCKVTVAFTGTTTIQANFTTSRVAKCLQVLRWSTGAGTTIAVDGTPQVAGNSTGAATLTIPTLTNVQHLMICANAFEGTAQTFTMNPDLLYGAAQGIATSGGSGVTNIAGTIMHKIKAAATSESCTTSGTAGDQAIVFLALKEVTAGGGGGPTRQPSCYAYMLG